MRAAILALCDHFKYILVSSEPTILRESKARPDEVQVCAAVLSMDSSQLRAGNTSSHTYKAIRENARATNAEKDCSRTRLDDLQINIERKQLERSQCCSRHEWASTRIRERLHEIARI
jgi:hypothetical protein